MGRASVFKQVLTWLKIVSSERKIKRRKFYKSNELYEMYATYCNTHHNSATNFQLRAFTTTLNKISRDSILQNFRLKYDKETGYSYIFVNENESRLNLDDIRISSRRKIYTPVPTEDSNNSDTVTSAKLSSQRVDTTSNPNPIPNCNATTNVQTNLLQPVLYRPSVSTPIHTLYSIPNDPNAYTFVSPSLVSTLQSSDKYNAEVTLHQSSTTLNQTRLSIIVCLPAQYQQFRNVINFEVKFKPSTSSEPSDHLLSVNNEEVGETNLTETVHVNDQVVHNNMDSPEALVFFFGKQRAKEIMESGIDSMERVNMLKAHILEQIERLQAVNIHTEGWRNVVRVDQRNETFSQHQIFTLRNRSTYLALFYHLCLDHFDKLPLSEIAKLVISKIDSIHLAHLLPSKHQTPYIVRSQRALMTWFREFRLYNHFPKFISYTSQNVLPPLLDANPELVEWILRYCRENINTLSVELLHDFIHTSALPKLNAIIKAEHSMAHYPVDQMLADFSLKSLCLRTVQNWMTKLGFVYQPRRKTYYVDSHESEVNVKYRSKFIDRYFSYELLSHRWYCITKQERDRLVKEGRVSSKLGYSFMKDNCEYFEYHVDDSPLFQEACKDVPFGGYLSVRKPENKKKIMMLGQDEVIMKQFLFTMLAWTLPDGSRPLLPKDEGMGLMISAYTTL